MISCGPLYPCRDEAVFRANDDLYWISTYGEVAGFGWDMDIRKSDEVLIKYEICVDELL